MIRRRALPGIFLFLVIFIGWAMVQRSPAAAAGTPAVEMQATSVPTPLPESPLEDTLLVVRAYYESWEQVVELLAWKEPWEVNEKEQYVLVDVSPAEMNLLTIQGFRVVVDEALTEQYSQPRIASPGQVNGIPYYACYRTVEETFASAQGLQNANPGFVEWLDIGDSWEKLTPDGLAGYDIMALVITNEAIPGPKPRTLFLTGIHAREYAPPEVTMRLAEYLLANYGTDPDVTWMVDTQEFHFILYANPDGRKKAEGGLFWRKNTKNTCADVNRRGVDLNRNFPFQWGCCNGSSIDPCSDLYRGASAASEPETQAVRNYVYSIFADRRGASLLDKAPDDTTGVFIDMHSYGGDILWPWGFQGSVAPNGVELTTLGRKMGVFNQYAPYQAYWFYGGGSPTDGTTDDFAYGERGVPAYTIEIGNAFFESCSSFENSVYPANRDTLLYAARAARAPYVYPAAPEVLSVNLTTPLVEVGTPVNLTASLDDNRYKHNAWDGVQEPVEGVQAAQAYVNDYPWSGAQSFILAAQDGAFDEAAEIVTGTLSTTGLSAGRNVAYVQGSDGLRWGVPRAAYFYVLDQFTATKTASSSSVAIGQVYISTLDIHVAIPGEYDLSLQIVDQAPEGTSILPETIRVNGTPDLNWFDPYHNRVLGSVALGLTDQASITVTYQVQVNSLPPDGVFQAGAEVNGTVDGMALPERTPPGPAVNAMVPDVAVEKSASTGVAITGDIVTYTIMVKNQGFLTATQVVMYDAMPDMGVLLRESGCDFQVSPISCPVGTLAPGASLSFQFVISDAATGVYTNSAYVTLAETELITENNTATVVVHVLLDDDGDGVADIIELLAPHGGDGNQDGFPDWQQGTVASLPGREGTYLTLEAPDNMLFNRVQLVDMYTLSPVIAYVFPHGLVSFALLGPAPDFTATVTMTLHSGQAPVTYWYSNPSSEEGIPWSVFLYNGEIGAVIEGNTLHLYLQDGETGDLRVGGNGQIVHLGGPAVSGYFLWLPLLIR